MESASLIALTRSLPRNSVLPTQLEVKMPRLGPTLHDAHEANLYLGW